MTPANVGGMALNVRYLQKAGVPSTTAVTGMGLNVLAGGVVHIVLLFVFFAWAGRSGSTGFSLPSSSKLLVAIAVLLAVLGIVLATRRGRHVLRTQVWRALKQSLASIGTIARSPRRLLALFGGSLGVTLAYIAALTCAANAFDAGVSFAQVGAVYLGASLLAAAAPTPGGLGAMEAALVAGFTAIGMDGGVAVADRAELPVGDVLAADPSRMAQLPAARPAQLHLTDPPSDGCSAGPATAGTMTRMRSPFLAWAATAASTPHAHMGVPGRRRRSPARRPRRSSRVV